MIEPKFKPGDYVRAVGCAVAARCAGLTRWSEKNVPIFRVRESVVVTCYGGTQVYYNLAPIMADGVAVQDVKLTEPELEAVVVPDAAPAPEQS